MARLTVPKELNYVWEARLVRFLGVSPLLAGLIVAAVVAATYFVPGFAFGLLPIPLQLQDSTIPIDPYSWGAIVTSLLAGFTVFALPYAQTRHLTDIADLAPVVPSLNRAGLRELYVQVVSGNARVRIAMSVVGWFVGLLVPLLSVPGALQLLGGPNLFSDTLLPPAAFVAAGWFLVVVPVLIGSLAKASYLMTSGARRGLRELEKRIRVGALDAELLRPLANAGLQTSFVWMVGVAIGLLFVLDANIPPPAIFALMAMILTLGGLAAVAPVMVGRRIMRQAKRSGLADVRAAIARLHLDVLDPTKGTAVVRPEDDRLIKLGALLAYEQRLDSARETPLDTPAMVKFMLYLAIPVGSWLGGAFVERMVDAALG